MPAIAAHYAFGNKVHDLLSEQVSDFLSEHKSLFTLGFQGPDPLFYYNPLSENPISRLGHDIHSRPAKEFFRSALDRKVAQGATLAYLLGVCCHYGLDRACHPFVNKVSGDSSIIHRSLESDFDLYIIRKHALSQPRYKMLCTDIDPSALAMAYEITERQAKTAVCSMSLNERVLMHPKAVRFAEKLLKKRAQFSTLCLKKEIHFRSECEQMSELFENAVATTADLVHRFYHAALSGIELSDFEENFEGDRC